MENINATWLVWQSAASQLDAFADAIIQTVACFLLLRKVMSSEVIN